MTKQVRDWNKDMKLCKNATPGPWKWINGNSKYRELGRIESKDEGVVCRFGADTIRYPVSGEEPIDSDCKFITEARSSLPYWLEKYSQESKRSKDLIEKIKGLMVNYPPTITRDLTFAIHSIYGLEDEEKKKKWKCIICGKEVSDYEPEYCCAGNIYGSDYACGCMGKPIEPPLCSDECAEMIYGKAVEEAHSHD